jgi:hypothetical protein
MPSLSGTVMSIICTRRTLPHEPTAVSAERGFGQFPAPGACNPLAAGR